MKKICCKGCGKTPSDLLEYRILSEENGYSSPEEACEKEEGTYNPDTGLFYCTDCYTKAGCPTGKA